MVNRKSAVNSSPQEDGDTSDFHGDRERKRVRMYQGRGIEGGVCRLGVGGWGWGDDK